MRCPAGVAVWYRYLTLFELAMRREHVSPSINPDDAHFSWGVRVSLASVAASTTKLALDATLAGYYSQAFSLIRHLLETWLQIVYVRLNERAAGQWFSPDGTQAPQQPNQNTIVNGIKKQGKNDQQLRDGVAVAEKLLPILNRGAHPSNLIFAQTELGKIGSRQMGANFNRTLLLQSLDMGTIAIMLVLREMTQFVPVDSAWQEQFTEIREERFRWLEAEMQSMMSTNEGP